MIGQKRNIEKINKLESLPGFITITGASGSGKKTLAEFISNKFGYKFIHLDNTVNASMKVIASVGKGLDPIVFIINGLDKMRANTVGTILKVAEEYTENVFIIATITNTERVPGTMVDRAYNIDIEPYSYRDKLNFVRSNFTKSGKHEEFTEKEYKALETAADICSNIGDIIKMISAGLIELSMVIEDIFADYFINKLSTSRLLIKMDQLLAYKNNDPGVDPILFFDAMLNYINRFILIKFENSKELDYTTFANIKYFLDKTQEAKNKLQFSSQLKSHVVTSWVLDVTSQ